MNSITENQAEAGQQSNPSLAEETRKSQTASYKLADPRRKSPFLACILSLLPGLGQVYVGYYRQAFINIILFSSVFALLTSVEGYTPLMPFGILFMAFFEFYNIIDAGRRASLYNLTLDGIENISPPDALTNNPLPIQGSYLIGGVMMVFGAIALSNTMFGLSLRWLEQSWPVFPMLMGAYLIYQAIVDGRSEEADEQDIIE